MSKPSESTRRAPSWQPVLASVLLAVLAAVPRLALAGEGGTSHVLPGANATLVDVPPTTPGLFLKPMYLHYGGDVSVPVPTAAGVVSDLDADANTLVLGAGYTFERTVLGAHYTVAAFLPYTWLDISARAQAGAGSVARHSEVSGLGDLTLVPLMLAWKVGDWQFDVLTPIYAPTGNYEKGRLGNTGLNYWTFDPMVGVVYSNKQLGFNAMLHVGYGINTENTETDYRSGDLLHLDAAVQQIVPVGPGLLALGVEGFYFDQVTGDSGGGAVLGDFKGRTAGVGPVVGYILPLAERTLSVEVKWLTELETKNRLKGDYVWLKVVFKF